MRQTLLELTQTVLSRLDSDEVNSISDTSESLQVAQIIKNKYYDIIARADLPEQKELFQLVPATDADKPVLMSLPPTVTKFEWIKYFDTNVLDGSEIPSHGHDINVDIVSGNMSDPNTAPGYKYVTILPIDQFMDMINSFNPLSSNVEQFNFVDQGNTFTFYYKNNAQPSYCTVISNSSVVFDSFDNTQDSTLQASKTLCWGQIVTPFQMVDNFVPDIDDSQFPLLLNEAVSLAFYELKQTPHALAAQEVKRQWNQVQKNKSIDGKPSHFDQLANFGRVPRTGGYASGAPIYRWMRGS